MRLAGPDVFALPTRARRHPSASPPPRRPLRARPTGSPAVSRRMHVDLHPWLRPCRHGCHVAPRPATGRSWAGSPSATPEARRARVRAGRRARAVYGRHLAGQLEAAPGIMLLAHHLAPQTESAKCTELGGPVGLAPRSVAGVDPATGDPTDLDADLSYVSHRRTLNTRRQSEAGHQVPHHTTERRPFVGPVQRGPPRIRRELHSERSGGRGRATLTKNVGRRRALARLRRAGRGWSALRLSKGPWDTF